MNYVASQPQYLAHIQPVWDALPESAKGEDDAVLVASYVDLRKVRPSKRGRGRYHRIAYLEHGIGQSYGNRHPGYPGGRQRDAVGLFLSPNETAAAADRKAYPAARVELVGCPRIEALPHRLGPRGAVVATTFHWDCRVAPETRSAFPAYQDAIAALAERYEVIGTAHPRIAAELGRWYRGVGIEFVPDFDDVCRRADLLVADNTSALYEFASTGRPVVVLNLPTYRTGLGLRFGEAAGVGVLVDDPSGLTEGVQEALSDPIERQVARESALSIVYQPRSSGAAQAVAAILDWLAEVQEAAA
jgi:hypothetical protein